MARGGGTHSTSMSSNSPSLRLLGFSLQPEPDPHNSPSSSSPFELDEGDVVWSSHDTDSRSSNSPTNLLRPHQSPIGRSNYGLSAALSDDHHPPLVRRKSTLNPSLSVTSAAKMIPPVVRSDNSNHGVRFPQSAPVNVPVWPKKKAGEFGSLDQLDEQLDDEIDEEDEMVPPHIIVARSHVTFSVFEGVGRTLKGRDLRRVRNAVFQQTGFID